MKNLFRFLLLFLATNLFAQNSQRFFQKIEFKNNTAEISVNDGLYQVKFYTSEMVETAFIPKNQTLTEDSHAVILSPKSVKYNFRETKGFAWIETSGITVKIQKVPFQISYYKGDELLISEKMVTELMKTAKSTIIHKILKH